MTGSCEGSQNKQFEVGNEKEVHVLDPCNMEIFKFQSCIYAQQVHLQPQLGSETELRLHSAYMCRVELANVVFFWWQVWVQAPVECEQPCCLSVLKRQTKTHSAVFPFFKLTILSDLFRMRIQQKKHSSPEINTSALHYHYSSEKLCWNKRRFTPRQSPLFTFILLNVFSK